MSAPALAPALECRAPGIWRLRLGTPEDLVPSALRAAEPRLDALAALPAVAFPPLDERWIRSRIDSRGVLLELPLAADEDVYGCGLTLKHLRQTGRKQVLRVTSDPACGDGSGHAPVPWYLSTAGYGVLVDTARQAAFCFGGHSRVEEAGGALGELGDDEAALYGAARAHGRVSIEIPRCAGVDLYLFAGPGMLDALRRYVLFSGGGCAMPDWALGLWYRGYTRHDHAGILALADGLVADEIPCSVFGLEPGWQTRAYSCTLEWDRVRFPDPAGTCQQLRARSMRVNLWEHAFIHPDSPLHDRLRPHSGDHRVWQGLVPDVSTEAARALLAARHRELIALGVSGFKLDECDGSDTKRQAWSWPDHARFPGGGDGEQLHALYGLGYMRAVHAAFDGAPTCGQVRSAGAFCSPLPFVLYSDLYDHREFLRGVCSAAVSGLLWTPELRHASSAEDLIRRLQALVVSPQFLVNAWCFPHPPWQQWDKERNRAGDLLPAAERAALTAVVRELCRLRLRLLPYLRQAFARYAADGMPPFRPLVLDHPDDPRLREVDDAWLVGPDLLVAPLVAGEQERQLPLPEGRWYRYPDGAVVEGGELLALQPAERHPPILSRDRDLITVLAGGTSCAPPSP